MKQGSKECQSTVSENLSNLGGYYTTNTVSVTSNSVLFLHFLLLILGRLPGLVASLLN